MSATDTAVEELRRVVEPVVRRSLGVEVARLEPLAGALGTRRFARVWLAPAGRPGARPGTIPKTLMARIEAPEDPARRPAGVAPEPALEPVRALLEREGLPVPIRYGADDDGRVELLQDLGTLPLHDAAAAADETELAALYTQACALVPRLQRIGATPGVAAFGRALDADQFAYKAQRFARWSLAGAGQAAGDVVREAFAIVAREALAAPQRLAHRDLQSANLHLVEAPPANAVGPRLVMIDLQGAFLAPPEYDLVCLLRDSYVELNEALVTALLDTVRPQLPDAPDPETFAHRFDLLTLTRKGKDHALYVYAAAERGDRRYLRYLPATRRYLAAAAKRSAARDRRFADLAELIEGIEEPPCEP